MHSLKLLRRAAAAALIAGCAQTPAFAQSRVTDILDLQQADAVTALRGMALHGNMRDKLDGGAWVVMATIATGFGRGDCGLKDGQKWLFMPALDVLSEDEIYELNRLVTANFRNAQHGPDDTQTDSKKLYPISAAVFQYLTTIYTKPLKQGMRVGIHVDCGKVREVWSMAENYVKNRSQAPGANRRP